MGSISLPPSSDRPSSHVPTSSRRTGTRRRPGISGPWEPGVAFSVHSTRVCSIVRCRVCCCLDVRRRSQTSPNGIAVPSSSFESVLPGPPSADQVADCGRHIAGYFESILPLAARGNALGDQRGVLIFPRIKRHFLCQVSPTCI